ncbi:DegT/DnrJ/EryC1/StrS family aminotransferase [Bacteroidota bacterium]|nr:DegT/DnrJ/EryC1/StrS family aminotransferase [Bacteroidota bacterium]MDC3114844.1 DegT/DnrJ/EryC1/StrS family aminotransferase [Bacteroidota bacterium]MDC3230172.1 DegT/DnrJ/EryC1/StrS family aminotransferase [Bacteroidota bacterium]
MIPIVKPYIPPRNQLMPALQKTIYSGYIAQGKKVEDFEKMLGQYFENNKVLTVNSGTSALHLSLILANVGPGDEVISTALTAEPTNTAISQTGAKVVWADIERSTGLICPKSAEKLINNKTKAIMIVHYAGMVANLNKFYSIRKKYNIPIIEDCAHAFGAEYKNKKLGYCSDFAIYSFQAIKHLTTIDGGLLILKKSSDYDRAKKLRWFGLDKTKPRLKNNITECGFKYHMNDVNATFGLIQLNYLKENVNKYIENGLFFDRELKDVDGIQIIKYHDDTKPSYWLYTAMVDRKDDFIEHMNSNGIQCSSLHLRNDRHSIFEDGSHLKGLESFYGNYVHWGCGWWITEKNRNKIVELIKKGW